MQVHICKDKWKKKEVAIIVWQNQKKIPTTEIFLLLYFFIIFNSQSYGKKFILKYVYKCIVYIYNAKYTFKYRTVSSLSSLLLVRSSSSTEKKGVKPDDDNYTKTNLKCNSYVIYYKNCNLYEDGFIHDIHNAQSWFTLT